LLLPLPSPDAEIPDISDEGLDEDELKVFIDECTDFVGADDERNNRPVSISPL
jgi:hypothetical protein